MGLTNVAPAFRLVANSQDVTAAIADRFVSLTMTDEAGIQSDTLDLVVADHQDSAPLQVPDTGAELELYLGYDDQTTRMGLFVVDETELSGPPDKLAIRAKGAPYEDSSRGKSRLQAQKTRSWEAGTTLGDLVATIAGEHGLQPAVADSLAGVALPHVDQTDESDINLLTRISRDYDALAKPAGGKLVLAKRGESKTISGQNLPTIKLHRSEVSTWRVTVAKRHAWDAVVAKWRDLDLATTGEEVAGSESAKNARSLPDVYPTKEAAIKAAKSEMDRSSRGELSLSITLAGRTDLVAEGRLQLEGFRPLVNGEWLITRVVHQLGKGGGYSVSIEAEALSAE